MKKIGPILLVAVTVALAGCTASARQSCRALAASAVLAVEKAWNPGSRCVVRAFGTSASAGLATRVRARARVRVITGFPDSGSGRRGPWRAS